MTIYSGPLDCPANSTKEYEVEVEGDIITRVRLHFPPGPQGLLHVRFFQGIKQIFPQPEEAYFSGDDEIIEWDEYYELAEHKSTIRVVLENKDDTYEHQVIVTLVVQDRQKEVSERIASAIAKKIMSIFRMLTGWV